MQGGGGGEGGSGLVHARRPRGSLYQNAGLLRGTNWRLSLRARV